MPLSRQTVAHLEDGLQEHSAPATDTPKVRNPDPPNGGYGWVCAICVAIMNANTWGLNASYGVFLAHFLATDTFAGATPLQYAFVGGLSISMAMLVGPLTILTTQHYGTHVTLAIGVTLQAVALLGASWASKLWQLFLSQGVAFGVGMGFIFVGSSYIPAQWFTTKRSLAAGVAAAGSGIGGLVYSLAAEAMIKSLGLQWCYRVLGIVSTVVLTVCVAFIRDRNLEIGSGQRVLELSLLRRLEFQLLGLWGAFSMFGYVALLFTLAEYARGLGLNGAQASIVTAVLNLGQSLGRPSIGYVSDRGGRFNVAGTLTLLTSIFILVIWIPANSFGALIFFALVAGAVAGTFWTTLAPLAAEVVGLKGVNSAVNVACLLVALPSLFSEPIILELVETSGSYLGAQIFAAVAYLAAAIFLFMLRAWKIADESGTAPPSKTPISELDTDLRDTAAHREHQPSRQSMWKHLVTMRRV